MIEAPVRDVFAVITDFLASEPSTEELLAYKLPDDLQERLSFLLYQNREAVLSCEERHELNDIMRANSMMTTIKLKTELRRRGLDA